MGGALHQLGEAGAAAAGIPDATATCLAACQVYLDALPIAAAVVVSGRRDVEVVARNPDFARLDALGERGADALSRVRATELIRRVILGESAGETFNWRDGGVADRRHFTVAIKPLRPSRRHAARALVTFVDRTHEVQAAASLRRETLADPLTGLANRAGFVEALENSIAEEGLERCALVIADLVRFSRVNESVGALGGDELIITVARRLKTVLRASDFIARIGTDEFAIAVRMEDGPGDVEHVARRVSAAFANPFRLSDFEIKVDAAIGCALSHGGDGTAETMVRHAQLALKLAKASGLIEVYRPASLATARRRFMMETELRRAIDRDELSLAFQPLVSLATAEIAGFEALARWEHPDLGSIPASEFIEVAEDSGLIVPLGRWVLDRAMRTLRDWDGTAGTPVPVYLGVNLSPIQIARDDVAKAAETALRSYGLNGRRFAFELTESAVVGESDRAGRTLAALKACDAVVAMDDFGTGFSNLASLQKLPIDILKIDRSFVTGMIGDPDKVAIVRAILSLANALGMATTAEGIETRELAATLAAMGCVTGQGYYFGRPLTASAALDILLNPPAPAPR